MHGIPGFLGAVTCVIAVAAAEYNFENDTQTEALFLGLSKKGRTIQTQTLYQLAGIAVTWIIAIPSGLLFGFIASKLPMPEKQFDDSVNFMHVEYGDDTAKFNNKDAGAAETNKVSHERAPSAVEMMASDKVRSAE